jgi:hypothetical protein
MTSNQWDASWQRPTFNDRKETLLGWTRRNHEILLWPGYGIVCPDEVTTNGSLWTLLSFHRPPVRLTPLGAAFFFAIAVRVFHLKDDEVATIQRWRAEYDAAFGQDGQCGSQELTRA